jgi:VanZ family protein
MLEWHQTRVPGRFGTVADVLLNLIGAIIGLIAAMFLL